MIEYGLLFGLGFVTATLAAFLLAPAIHRRIVRFTEDRLIATVPVSPQELRAQKDMVRAEMAAAQARTGHDLKLERHKAAQLSIANDRLSAEAGRLYGENADLRAEIDGMHVQAAEIRAGMREEEMRHEATRRELAAREQSERGKDGRIDELNHLIQRLDQDIANLKIDLATRDTEAESLKARINSLRDEREQLRADLKQAVQRAKDAELRLAREENRARRLEERLNAEVSGSVDKDTIIERRLAEISRLKERLKSVGEPAREAPRPAAANLAAKPADKPVVADKPAPRVKAEPAAANEIPGVRIRPKTAEELRGLALPAEKPARVAKPAEVTALPVRIIGDARAAELTEEARAQANRVAESLMSATPEDDEALRGELADIAAKMIAITGQKEGAGSPIRSMIAPKPQPGRDGRTSLSERASRLLHQD